MRLPRVQSSIRARESWSLFVLAGVEAMTREVRSGKEISEQTYADIDQLARRVGALVDAVDARTQMIEE